MADVREGRKRKHLDDYSERQAKYSRGSGFDFQNVPEQTGAGEGVNILNDEHVQRIEDPFDTFGVPSINNDYDRFEDHYIEPFQEPTDKGPITFKFRTQGGERFDSSFSEIENEFEIIDTATNKKTVPTDDIAVINSFPITVFDKIEVKINDTVVTDSSSGNHAYHAYFQQKFSYSKKVKKEVLKKTEYYFEEEPDKVDAVKLDTNATKDDHFKQKHAIFVADTKSVKTRTQFYLDIFNVHKYYPTDLDFTITFTRNKPSFCLMGEEPLENKYKIKMKRMRLVLRKIFPSENIVKLEEKLSALGKTHYIPYSHGIMTNYVIEHGNRTKKIMDVTLHPSLPKKMFVFIVDHQGFSGKLF